MTSSAEGKGTSMKSATEDREKTESELPMRDFDVVVRIVARTPEEAFRLAEVARRAGFTNETIGVCDDLAGEAGA